MNVHVTMAEPTSQSSLTHHVATAFRDALAGNGKLEESVLAIPGMSGRKYRMFINNLIGSLIGPRYLEIGVWSGSTLCSAMYKNAVTAFAIDNWSYVDDASERFFNNLARFKRPDAHVSFLESDFRTVNYSAIGPFDVYLFDGPHAAQDQRDGIVLPQPALSAQYVQIVDDWNWAEVRDGTMAGIHEAGLSIDYQIEIRTTLDNTHGLAGGEAGDWHNGYFIGVLSKADDTSTSE